MCFKQTNLSILGNWMCDTEIWYFNMEGIVSYQGNILIILT